MRTSNLRVAQALGALIFALTMIPSAVAQCGMPAKLAKPTNWHPEADAPHFLLAAFGKGAFDSEPRAAVVGMWHVILTADTSNGGAIPATVIDNALAVWHSDNTEIMNSVRPPQDGNFCMGVWEQTGRSTYYLNHFAWYANQWPNSTDNGIGMPVGPTQITETIALSDDCNHFSGTFTLTAYDATGKIVVQTFTGAISGTRITTNTTEGDLLL